MMLLFPVATEIPVVNYMIGPNIPNCKQLVFLAQVTANLALYESQPQGYNSVLSRIEWGAKDKDREWQIEKLA